MFEPIKNGKCIEIPDNCFGYIFKCWIPEPGYGFNVSNGQIEPTEIIKRSEIPEEQYWERQLLPTDYKAKRKTEAERQKSDPLYQDPYLKEIRDKEWGRRLRGIWFWNYNPIKKESELIYLIGSHYLYINWWKYQGKFLDFRIPDLETFYVTQYCIEDPFCLGENFITMRKAGKTAISGCVAYERTSRLENHHCGIQSKGDDDGWEVFKKSIVYPWQKLPHFYRPIFDTNKGDDPNDELRFFHPSKRGEKAEEEKTEEALESWIDFKSSEESAYDGPELHTYISDETGKTRREVSVKERQNVTRYCTEINGEIKGFHFFTTTVEVEDDEEENEEFTELTKNSNPLIRDANGMTISGLYTFFQPAYKYIAVDKKYGHPDIEKAKTFIINKRAKLEQEGKLRELSSVKRKQPMTFREAFASDGKDSLYNPELLNMQYDEISFRDDLIEKGDLEWEGGFEFVIEREINGHLVKVPNNIIWVPNPNGKFEKVKGWWPKEPNKVYENNGKYLPNNNHAFRIGCDPFKYDKTKDKRRSNCAAFAYQIPDPIYPDEKYDDMLVLKYSDRPEANKTSSAQVLKMAWLCGCQSLFERNFNKWKDHFTEWDCEGFLMWLPGEVEPGIYTDGKGTVVQTICNYTEAYINAHIKRVFFKSLIKKDGGWLGFKVEDTQVSDEPMAAGFTFIAVKGKKYIRREEREQNIEDILPYRKAG